MDTTISRRVQSRVLTGTSKMLEGLAGAGFELRKRAFPARWRCKAPFPYGKRAFSVMGRFRRPKKE